MENINELDESSNSIDSNPNINFISESEFWDNNIIKNFTYYPDICPYCNSGRLILFKVSKEDILNPYKLRCLNKKCKTKINIRKYSFFKIHPHLPASIIMMIFKEFMLDAHNVKIKKKI